MLSNDESEIKVRSIKSKFRKSFYKINLFLIIMPIFSIIGIFKIVTDYEHLITNYGFSQGYAGQLGIEFNSLNTNLRNLILETDDAEMQKLIVVLEQQADNDDAFIETLELMLV